MALEHGRLLADRYELSEVIGQGGMGTVWKAWDRTLGRDVAVKEIRLPAELPSRERSPLYRRAVREAQAAARLRHPSIIDVYDVVTADERPWIVMELIEGTALSELVARDGPLLPERAAEIGAPLAAALRAAHEAGVLHAPRSSPSTRATSSPPTAPLYLRVKDRSVHVVVAEEDTGEVLHYGVLSPGEARQYEQAPLKVVTDHAEALEVRIYGTLQPRGQGRGEWSVPKR